MRIKIITLGTRGDVQPYVALAQGLNRAGHEAVVLTSPSFEDFVKAHGVLYSPIRADYSQLVQTEAGAKSISGSKIAAMQLLKNEVLPMMRRALNDIAIACKDAQAIIYHPKAIGSYDMAQALDIPLIAAHPVPILRAVNEFANPALGGGNRGAFLNRLSYNSVNKFGTTFFSGIVNEWRKNELGLPKRSLSDGEETLNGRPVPAICGCSPSVLPQMANYENMCISGFWFLKDVEKFSPSDALSDFLEAGDPPIYIGFGSMKSDRPNDIESITIEAVRQSGLRALISSNILTARSERTLPRNIMAVGDIPHTYLFKKVRAVLHHGGVGTTSEALREGLPMVIASFMGDQPFWGQRMVELNVSPEHFKAKNMNAESLATALERCVNDLSMIQTAKNLSKLICSEDGISTAIEFISNYL